MYKADLYIAVACILLYKLKYSWSEYQINLKITLPHVEDFQCIFHTAEPWFKAHKSSQILLYPPLLELAW